MTTTIRIIDLFGVSERGNGVLKPHMAICPGDSFVTRIDTEAPEFPGRAPFGISGFQVHCSGGSPVQPLNSNPGGKHPAGIVKQFPGAVVPAGIKDMVVRDRVWLVQFGYAGTVAPVDVAVPDSLVGWRQSQSDVSDCFLKGLTMWGANYVFSLQLQFDCRPPRPPPLPQPVPTTQTSLPTTSATTTLAQLGSTPSAFVNTLSSSQVALNPPFTTTITVGSGPSATTIITVITPGVAPAPLTVTLAGGTAIVITQVSGGGAAATFAPVPGPSLASTSSLADDVAFLSALIAVLCSAVAALAVVFTYLRLRRQRSKPDSQQRDGIELTNVGPSAPNHARVADSNFQQVDPPAYLVVPIPEPGPVQGMLNGLAGKSAKSNGLVCVE